MMNAYYNQIAQCLSAARGKQQLLHAVTNAPFCNKLEATRMALGIVVLLLVDSKTGMIHRVALSDTELAEGAKTASVKKFEDITIPLDTPDNVIAKAVRTGKPQYTANWYYLFTPALSAEEARFNQTGGAIDYSAVYPLAGTHGGGALIFSYYQHPETIDPAHQKFMKFYQQLVSEHLAAYL